MFKKILIIRPDAIGDLTLATPAIAAIKEKFPKAHIAVWVRPYNQAVIQNNPAIDEIIIDDLYDKIFKKQRIFPLKYLEWVKRIKAKNFDLAINFNGEFAYALIAFLARIPFRIGDRGKILYSWMYSHPALQHFNSWAIHEVEHHFELLKPLNITIKSNSVMHVYPAEKKIEEAKQLLHTSGIPGKPLMAVNVGTGGANKPWKAEYFVDLVKQLAQKYNTKIVLLGGPKEESLVAKMLSAVADSAVSLINLPLDSFIALVSLLDLYIGNDTGPSHIAAALNAPSIVLFTSKYQKPGRWAPWGNRHKFIKNISNCPYPCRSPSCKRDLCIDEISVEEVFSAACGLLEGEINASPAEDKLERERLSFNILLAGDSPEKEAVYQILQKNNWRVWSFSQPEIVKLSLKDLQAFYHFREINILHVFGKVPFKLRLSALLTTLNMPFPVMLVEDQNNRCSNFSELVRFYEDKFNHRVV
ncbi:MAG: glycosyltransferase family 9 protein [Candidatus Margulisbacteria bacterium]|nr:glycosyltransferase family 9 protein [Candidatus Margulisiibacteriota bacterium]